MFLNGAQRRTGLLGHALFRYTQMNLCAVGKFLAGARDCFFQKFFCLCVLLLLKILDSLFIELELLFEQGVNHLPHRFRVCRRRIKSLLFQWFMLT